MATIFKCDHCGKIISPDDGTLLYRSVWAGQAEHQILQFDLCMDCTSEFEQLALAFAPNVKPKVELLRVVHVGEVPRRKPNDR